MITTVTNIGDSLGIQLPKSLLKGVPISENDCVEIIVEDSSIIIKRSEIKKHFTTKERITAFCDTMEVAPLYETDWGKPQGKEIW
jgi:antitoxin component of MazEF toxin-antitoxin module